MTMIADLVLERREQNDETLEADLLNTTVMVTPPISEDYWAYRVCVADGQAVVGFPKFTTIGIGFAVEEDWNLNLPHSMSASHIANHIWPNRGTLPDNVAGYDLLLHAVGMIQAAVAEDRPNV